MMDYLVLAGCGLTRSDAAKVLPLVLLVCHRRCEQPLICYSIPSHINVFLIDKEYTLYCPLPEYRRTCEKKKLKLGQMSRHTGGVGLRHSRSAGWVFGVVWQGLSSQTDTHSVVQHRINIYVHLKHCDRALRRLVLLTWHLSNTACKDICSTHLNVLNTFKITTLKTRNTSSVGNSPMCCIMTLCVTN